MSDEPDAVARAVKVLIEGVQLLQDSASLGDFIYDIREREGLGWDGPKTKSWGMGCVLIKQAMKVLG